VDQEKIEKLQQGISPIYEPGLGALINKNMEDGRLFFTTDAKTAVHNSDLIFIAVGTRQTKMEAQTFDTS
jgi:UDPglucose 6-dehydrogenase